MPQAIKDVAPDQGHPDARSARRCCATSCPTDDALMVQRMKAAGCIVIGKTNTPEFGLGSHTFNEVFGVTRNAFDRTKSAGGSSGGAAVALATRMLPVADGSDFMGSLRNPAGWNNVFGFRPSQGRVPRGRRADVWVAVLSTEGPMARTVRTSALLLDVQAGYDARVPLSLAARSRSRLASTTSTSRARASAGSATSTATCRWSPACSRPAARRCARSRRWAARSKTRESRLRARRRSGARGSCCARGRRAPACKDLYDNPALRPHIKPEAVFEVESGAKLTRVRRHGRARRCARVERSRAPLLRALRLLVLPTAQVFPFDAATRLAARDRRPPDGTYHAG